MAGGPIAVADQHNTLVNGDLKYYTNKEMLALNQDKFVGKPLVGDITNEESQIWYGKMSNGDYVVGLFNREDTPKVRAVEFSRLGISGAMKIRDLWKHTDEGEDIRVSATLAPHSCKIVRLSKAAN